IPPAPHLADLTFATMEPDGYDEFIQAEQRGFQEQFPTGLSRLHRAVIDPQRYFGYRVGQRWVATFGSYARKIAVPGGTMLPVSAITAVTVHTAYRRRGLLRAMMSHELDQCRQRGEPLAALYASEFGIYGRFGFGQATRQVRQSG